MFDLATCNIFSINCSYEKEVDNWKMKCDQETDFEMIGRTKALVETAELKHLKFVL